MDNPTIDEIRDRRMRVYKLRREGKSVAQISELVGVSPTTVSKDMAWLRAQGYDLGGTDLQIYEHARDRARTTGASDPSRIAELRHQIVEMRLQGYVPRDIARTIGLSLQTVQTHLAAVFTALTAPRAEEARQLELDRLDRLLVALEVGIDNGDPKAITAALKVSAQRALLQGLNKPIQVETTVVTIDAVDAEIQRLTEQLSRVTGEQTPVDGEVIDTRVDG